MKLSMKLIFSDLEDTKYICRPKEHESAKFISARLVQSWKDIKSREVLYIADENFDYLDYRFPPNDQEYTLLLINETGNVPVAVCKQVKVYTVYTPMELTNEILSVFDKYNAWEDRLNEILNQDGSITDLLTASVPVFNNAIYVVDSSFKVLAITDIPIMMEMSALWRHLILDGYMPISIVSGMQKQNELYSLSRLDKVSFFRSKMIPNVFISTNLKINDVSQGKLFVVGMLNRLRERDLELTEHLASVVEIALKRMPSFVLGHGGIHEHFLMDVLSGKQTETSFIAEQLVYWGWQMGQYYSLLLVDTEKYDTEVMDAIRTEMRTVRNGQGVYLDGILVVIFPHNSMAEYKENSKYLHRYLENLKIQGYISMFFKGFQYVREHYLQVREAIALKQPRGSYVQDYKDYVLPLFLREKEGKSVLNKFCNQSIYLLREHDHTYGTKYYQTLDCFLRNERSLKQTAVELDIHRNTLINRVDRILEITDLELDDYNTRMWLMLSFEIIKNQ